MPWRCGFHVCLSLVLLGATTVADAAEARVSFEQSADEIDAYDFVEVTVKVPSPTAANPFRDAGVTGQFQIEKGPPVKVEGFCDSADGSLYRIRFMPSRPGRYSYTVEYRQGDFRRAHSGNFAARDGKRPGLVRIDKEHLWHFLWEGTGEHYFWNGTTTYWLLGWQDEDVIRQAIDRLARLKVNRIRVALCGRTTGGERWYEPLVVNTDKFHFRLNPWVAARPDSVENPGFDVTRYNLPFWQKCERMLRHAREKGMVVSIIFYLDGRDPGVEPFGKARMGCEDEQRYYRYGVARLAAFSNLMWDVTNEYQLFRDEPWTEKMGALIKAYDPYKHLASVHGHGDFRFRTSPWADFAMYQSWDEGGSHAFLLNHRQAQAKTGRPMPQVNEEYGYEDHYPGRWGGGRRSPARAADNRRRLAWGMYMAGGYQTTGERADRGTGKGADSGGGWINGRGDSAMTMLEGYGHIVTCFTSLPWWKMEPRDDLVNGGNYCLAEPGRQYLVYLPKGGNVDLKLGEGKYQARWFNPRDGQWKTIGIASGPKWTSPQSPDGGDWAIVLRREDGEKRPAASLAAFRQLVAGTDKPAGVRGSGRVERGASPLTEEQRTWLGRANRHDKHGWVFLHIQGGPRQRGFQHGYLLAKEISRSLHVTKQVWQYESGMDWPWLVEKTKTILGPGVDAENLAEIDGIVEGLRVAGLPASRQELIAYNGIIELIAYWWPKEKEKLQKDAASPPRQACSAFIATGSMTADGRVVLGHNTMSGYADASWNVILDIQPDRGHRILMQSGPGWIHSGTDFFITDAGLVGAETTIGGFKGFDEKGTAEFVRMRRATQDASSIDEWCAIMKKGNNGGYANAWLLGDVNANEIARLELGLKHVRFEKKKDGYFVGSNVAEDLKILRFETTRQETDIRLSSVARRVRWKQLMGQHAGKIDLELAKAMEADHFDSYLQKDNPGGRSLCGHDDLDGQTYGPDVPFAPSGTIDAKVVDARMARQMSFAARWGSGCGAAFDAEKFLAAHPQFDWLRGILTSRPSRPWAEFRAGERQ